MNEKEVRKDQLHTKVKTMLPLLGLIILITVFAVLTKGRIVSSNNLLLVFKQSSMQIVACIGATFVLAHGNLDFSIGANIALSAGLGALAGMFISPAFFIPVCIASAIGFSVLMCFIHISCKVPAIVVSWAMMFFNRGVMLTLVGKYSMKFPRSLIKLDNTIFYIVVMVICGIVGYYLLEYTKVGKYNKAIGSNYVNACMNGIAVNKYKYLAYIISGTAVGICAVMYMARGRSAQPLTASGTEIDVLISVVLGGMSLGGGTKTRLSAGIIGALILGFLTNGLTMVGVDDSMIDMVKGIIFLLVVILTFDRKSSTVIV